MADKYISLQSGVETEVEATVTGGTATEAGDIVALDANGRIDETLLPVGVTPDVYEANAAEVLSASNPFVYVKSDGEIANASADVGGNPCIGFINEGAASGASARIYFEGRATGLSGLTVGARYYLSDVTPGGVITTPVSGTGKLHQYVGRAITATTIAFEADDHILRA